MSRDAAHLFNKWLKLMRLWEFDANEAIYDSLVKRYSEPGRHYHTLAHVGACMRHLDSFDHQLTSRREVELALWFHDAIYDQGSSNNELRSAELAASFMADCGAATEEIARVRRLILVTEHNAPTQTDDESILVDIDLSILGADPAEYDTFERNIREEYKLVPLDIYRQKRIEVLQGFLARPQIYHNAPLAVDRERQARENLSRAIENLQSTQGT